MWRILLPALLVVAACTRGEATAPAQPAPDEPASASAPATPAPDASPSTSAPAGPAPALPSPGDAALPATDEIPLFLTGKAAAPPDDPPVEVELDEDVLDSWPVDEAPVREPTLRELMRGVQVGEIADDGDESWAFIGGGHREEAGSEPEDPPAAALVVVDVVAPPPEAPAAVAPEPEEDPCAPLRRLLDKRNHYVRRTAAERDAFGYVESEEDLAALRLLQGLHRCAQHPDDEDCRQRPIEVDISEVEIPAHQIHRQPSDLNAEGRLPNEIPHDPEVLDLLHRLDRCEKSQIVQPLLQR